MDITITEEEVKIVQRALDAEIRRLNQVIADEQDGPLAEIAEGWFDEALDTYCEIAVQTGVRHPTLNTVVRAGGKRNG